MGFDKKGIGDYLVPIIIVVVVVVIVFVFLGNFMLEDDADWAVCKNSIDARADWIPSITAGDYNIYDFKRELPLKCGYTDVVIELDDVKNGEAGGIIGQTLLECWALYGNGDKNAFPSTFYKYQSTCSPCAQISLTHEAKEAMIKDSNLKIDIQEALITRGVDGESYLSILNNVGISFPALNLASSGLFDLGGESFSVSKKEAFKSELRDRKTGVTLESSEHFFKLIKHDLYVSKITLPKYFDPKKGDLIISHGTLVLPKKQKGFSDHISFLFYFQNEQDNDYILETQKSIFYSPGEQLGDNLQLVLNPTLFILDNDVNVKSQFCNRWEGTA